MEPDQFTPVQQLAHKVHMSVVPPPFPPSQTCEWVNAAYLGMPLNSSNYLDSVQITQKQAGKRTCTSATSPAPHTLWHADGEITSAFRRKTDYRYASSVRTIKHYILDFSKSSEVSKYFQFKISFSPETQFSDENISTEIALSVANKALYSATTVYLCVLLLPKPVSFSIPTCFCFQYGLQVHGWRLHWLRPSSALLLSSSPKRRGG